MSSIYTNYTHPDSAHDDDDDGISHPPPPPTPTPAPASVSRIPQSIPIANPSPKPKPKPSPSPKKAWVDPARLPNATYETLDYPDAREVEGNVPLRAKQLALNTFGAYGVSGLPSSPSSSPSLLPCSYSSRSRSPPCTGEEVFGRCAGRKVRFVRIDSDVGGGAGMSSACGGMETGCGGRPVMSVTAVAEVHVDRSMVNGNGMMHGGCIAYLIDNCASIPLVVLGVLRNRNGVGVTQAMNVMFHAPAPLGTKLEIVSTSLTLGGRSMSSKCEILDKSTGRLVASAFLNKMEPRL